MKSLAIAPSSAPAAETEASLTPAQARLYRWLEKHDRGGRPPPTLDEVCQGLGLRSRGSLHKHLQVLVAKNLVQPMGGLHRGIRLRAPRPSAKPDAAGAFRRLPLLGRIAAGQPIAALPDPADVSVPERLTAAGPCYVLEVRGNSMTDAAILDGDWAIIEHRDTARDGEIVVALIDGESATLKRIQQRPEGCVLWPANGSQAPQPYPPDRVDIQGVLVGLMRRYL